MSKKKKEDKGQAKQESSNKGIAVLIILCFLGILPVLVWVSLPESAPYESVTTGSQMVQVAAHEAGLEICTQTPLTVPVPGATSGVLYGLSPSCNAQNPATTVRILVVGFSSTEATNSAIYRAQVAVENGVPVNTAGFYSGFNVILVQGSATNTADVEEISTSLLAQGAVRIF